jgi:hypothetical protein
MARSKVATVRARKSAAGKAKAGKKPSKKKPVKGLSRAEIRRSAEELAGRIIEARHRLEYWLKPALSLFNNDYDPLYTPEKDEDMDGPGALSEEDLKFLSDNDLYSALNELGGAQEILEYMTHSLEQTLNRD